MDREDDDEVSDETKIIILWSQFMELHYLSKPCLLRSLSSSVCHSLHIETPRSRRNSQDVIHTAQRINIYSSKPKIVSAFGFWHFSTIRCSGPHEVQYIQKHKNETISIKCNSIHSVLYKHKQHRPLLFRRIHSNVCTSLTKWNRTKIIYF